MEKDYSRRSIIVEQQRKLNPSDLVLVEERFIFPQDIYTETTPLLSQSVLNQRQPHQRKQRAYSKLCAFAFTCIIFLSFFMVVGLFCLPIQQFEVVGLQMVHRTSDVLEFDLLVSAVNTNVRTISLDTPDLDVFAALGFVDHDDASKELLAHVRTFTKPATLCPTWWQLHNKQSTRIMISHANNTLGKIIYSHFPFTLTVSGRIYYSFLNFVYYHVDVCSYFYVRGDTSEARSCL